MLSEKAIRLGKLAGKECDIQTGQGVLRLRLFSQPTRLYVVSFSGTQEQLQGADAATFLDSFRLPDRSAEDVANKAPDAGGDGGGRKRSTTIPTPTKKITANELTPILETLRAGSQRDVDQALDLLIAAEPINDEKSKVVAALEPGVTAPSQDTRKKPHSARVVGWPRRCADADQNVGR